MGRVTLGWALGSQGHFPEPGVCFSLSHLAAFLCVPCLLERQALLWVSGQLNTTPSEERAGEAMDLARRAAQGWNVLPHSKKRDVLPASQQPQALMRHLCLGKGNVIWDIKTKALFGSPRESGAYSGIRVHGEPPGNAVASAPRDHQRPTLAAGSRAHRVEAGATEKNGPLSRYPQRGLLGLNTPRGGEVKGQQSSQWQEKRGR